MTAEPGSLEALWNAALVSECAALAERGITVAVVHASAAAAEAMGEDPMSTAGAPRAVSAGRSQGVEQAAGLLAVARP